MSEYSEILDILNVIDIIDTVDLISDINVDNSFMHVRLNDTPVLDEEELMYDDVNIPQRQLRDMTNPLEMFSNDEFKHRYSLSKDTVLYVMKQIVHGLERTNRRGKPVPPIIELLITLKFMVSGTYQSMIDDLHGVSQPTISRLIEKVSSLLAELRHVFIKFPSSTQLQHVSKRFLDEYNMPNVIGCLGVTHVGIKNPGGQLSEAYINENGYFSYKVQVFCAHPKCLNVFICGHNMEFLDFVAKWPGSMHESKIFGVSDIKYELDNKGMDVYLLASAAYPPMRHLLTPVKNPKNESETKYNNLFSQAYIVTKTVDEWKRRFKCLTTVLANKEETRKSIIYATAVLHNIAIQRNEMLDDSIPSALITEPKCKDVKRLYPLDKPLEADTCAESVQNLYIHQHFSTSE